MGRVVVLMTIAIPANISTTAGMIAGGGTWPNQAAAIAVEPGISSRIASETMVADVVASTLFTTECPSSWAPRVTARISSQSRSENPTSGTPPSSTSSNSPMAATA